MAEDRRLSCTAEVLGDVLIDVPPESQVHRQVVRKGLDVRDFTIDPVVRLHYVEVTPPDLALPTGDLGRLFDALEREWGLTGLGADLSVIRGLQPALESGKYARDRRRPSRPPGDRRLAGPPRASPTASRSTSGRRRSPGTWRTWRTVPSSQATAS